MSLSDSVWEIRYRPKMVESTILPTKIKKMVKEQIASEKVPNYLFSGPPGCGKTTLAYAIANELGADVLFINASLDGNLDLLRTKLTQFVSSVSFTDSKKIVILDEFEYISQQSQPAMRGFLDEFSSNSIFIFTCNYPERIISPLKSRLVQIEFGFTKDEKTPALMQMLKAACSILDSESVKYDKKTVSALVAKNFPDFRKTIGELQRYSSSGEIDSGILESLDNTGLDQLVTAMKAKDFAACRQWIATNQMDTSQFYRFFYNKVYPMMVPQSRPQLILHIGESQFRAAFAIDLEINSASFIVNVLHDCVFQ